MSTEGVTHAHRWRAHAARASLALAIVGLAWWVNPVFPREQTLVFDLGKRDLSAVRRLAVNWRRVESNTSEGGFATAFDDAAPRIVEHGLDAPNGEYELDIVLSSSPDERRPLTSETFVRRVRLQEQAVRVLLNGPRP